MLLKNFCSRDNILDSDDLADLVDAILYAVNIERLNSVHIDDARVDALLSQFLGSGDRKADSVAVSDDRDIFAVPNQMSLADLKRRGIIIDYRDSVSCKAQINGSVISCSCCYELSCRIIAQDAYYGMSKGNA